MIPTYKRGYDLGLLWKGDLPRGPQLPERPTDKKLIKVYNSAVTSVTEWWQGFNQALHDKMK